MRKSLSYMFLALTGATLVGCGSMNSLVSGKTDTVEYFQIYDLKTGLKVREIGAAATKGVAKNINNMQTAYPVNMSGEVPEKPNSMELVDPFAGSALGAFTSGAGSVGVKIAKCDGAAWTAQTKRESRNDNEQTINICLFPYTDGYQLAMYGRLTKQSGGFGVTSFARAAVRKGLGSPEQFLEKAFNDTVMELHKADENAKIEFLRGYPEPEGLPWVSNTFLGK